MTGLLCAALLALSPCSAAPYGSDRPSRGPAAEAVKSLEALPESARAQLRRLYDRYAELVGKKVEEGWRADLLSGAIIEHPDEVTFPARQLEEALEKREAELQKLEEELAKNPDPSEAPALKVKDKQAEVKSMRRRNSRSKGVCIDWSDLVWAELLKLEARDWSVSDQPRRVPPRHTGAVVCTPAEEPSLCLVFDPWRRAHPDVYPFKSWDEGSFEGRLPAEYFLHQLPEPR